ELLTVIAIITILIGIVTPALNAARTEAKKSATKAIFQAIATGCEMFKNDQNEHPQSNPAWFGSGNTADQKAWDVGRGSTVLSGANLIVEAMVGLDLNGYDPKPSIIPPPNQWDRRWFQQTQPNSPARTRRSPYITPDKIKLTDT